MTKVRIDAGGRNVEIEAPEANVDELRAQAIDTWKQTEATSSNGPALGFQASKETSEVEPTAMGGYGGGYMWRIKA